MDSAVYSVLVGPVRPGHPEVTVGGITGRAVPGAELGVHAGRLLLIPPAIAQAAVPQLRSGEALAPRREASPAGRQAPGGRGPARIDTPDAQARGGVGVPRAISHAKTNVLRATVMLVGLAELSARVQLNRKSVKPLEDHIDKMQSRVAYLESKDLVGDGLEALRALREAIERIQAAVEVANVLLKHYTQGEAEVALAGLAPYVKVLPGRRAAIWDMSVPQFVKEDVAMLLAVQLVQQENLLDLLTMVDTACPAATSTGSSVNDAAQYTIFKNVIRHIGKKDDKKAFHTAVLRLSQLVFPDLFVQQPQRALEAQHSSASDDDMLALAPCSKRTRKERSRSSSHRSNSSHGSRSSRRRSSSHRSNSR